MKEILKFLKANWLIVMVGLVVFVDIIIHISYSCCLSGNETLIIGFIGVVASIVVIGNLAQVSAIRAGMDKEMKELNAKIENYNELKNVMSKMSSEVFELNQKKTTVKKKKNG